MKTAQEIAQWVIDNRYPKSENDKVSDFEMYQILIEFICKLSNKHPDIEISDKLYCLHCGQTEPCAGNSPETCYHPKVL